MSKFEKIQTSFVEEEKDCLIDGLVDMGFPREAIEVHENPQNLRGYQFDRRPEKAHIIIRKNNVGDSSNDLGFELMPDGKYLMRVSEYDRKQIMESSSRVGMKYNEKFVRKLAGHVGLRVAEKNLVRQGYRVAETLPIGTKKRRLVFVK